MGELSIELEWCASWQQDNRYYCTLFIKRDYMNTSGFNEFLTSTFGTKYGAWRYDNKRHGVEVWFTNKEDMLTFKMMTQSKCITEL